MTLMKRDENRDIGCDNHTDRHSVTPPVKQGGVTCPARDINRDASRHVTSRCHKEMPCGQVGRGAAPITLTLPWPPATLSPNSRHAHWSTLARAKRRFRAACALVALAQGASRINAPELAISLTFVPPDRRTRDLDNCIAAMKSGLDGLADVFGVDDSRWTLTTQMSPEVGGVVRVGVSPWPGASTGVVDACVGTQVSASPKDRALAAPEDSQCHA